jgi:hypothetical protein
VSDWELLVIRGRKSLLNDLFSVGIGGVRRDCVAKQPAYFFQRLVRRFWEFEVDADKADDT